MPLAAGEFQKGSPLQSVPASTPTTAPERDARDQAALAKSAHTPAPSATGSAKSSAPSANGESSPPHDVPLDATDGGGALLAYVARHMPGPHSDPLAAAELVQGLTMQGAPAGSPPTTRGTLLAHALHAASVDDAHGAAETLDAMAKLDFTHMDRARSGSDAEAKAWHAARRLARTDAGFEALEHLRRTVGNQPPEANPTTRMAHLMMLQAADALEPDLDAAAYDPAPGATAQRHAPPAGAEPSGAPFAWRAYHAAQTLTAHGRAAMSPDQKGTFFAWRQNFRDDGRGSELAQARVRLNKFAAKTIDQGADSRWKTYLPRLFGKSVAPQRALGYGIQGALRGQVTSEKSALHKAMKAALPPLIDRPEMRPAAALSHARPERSIAELAALHVWLESGGFTNDRPDAQQLKAIAKRAEQLCAQLEPRDVSSPDTLNRMQSTTAEWVAADPHVLARDPAFKQIVKRPFTIKRLASWGKVANVPPDSPFWEKVDGLMQAARPSVSAALDVANADEVRESLKEVALDLRAGANLRLSDGGRIGISTRGLSANITRLLHAGAVPISPRIDMRASSRRAGVIGLSRGPHGADLFLGTEKVSQTYAGVGVLVGYDMDVGLTQARAGVITRALLHSQEVSEPKGISLRVARRVNTNGTGYDDDATREKLAGVIDHVFDETTNARRTDTGGANGTWNRLAERYFDDPDVSVSWTDSTSRTAKRGTFVDAGLWVNVPKLSRWMRPGFAIGGGRERITKQTLDSVETSGRMQIEQHQVGNGIRQIGRMGNTISGHDNGTLNEGEVTVGYVSLAAPSATWTLNDDTRVAKVRISREGTSLIERACLLDSEYSNAESYIGDVEAHREQWISLFAAQAEDEQRAERKQAELNGVALLRLPSPRDVAAERLDAYLANVRMNRRLNQTYMHRYQLRGSAAKQLDVLTALGAQLPTHGAAEARAKIDAKVQRILNDPSSWVPVELKVKERSSVSRGPGLNFLAQMQPITTATGIRELFAEKIPFALRQKLTAA